MGEGAAIPVGPGRGSGAGSAGRLRPTITNLDPLRFELLFERFLNPERVSMPDFDIDFCSDRRDEVIDYVADKYGDDLRRAASSPTARCRRRGSPRRRPRARTALRRGGPAVQARLRTSPANPVTLARPSRRAELQEARRHRRWSRACRVGPERRASTGARRQHAAGIVITDRPLEELVAADRDPKRRRPSRSTTWKMVEVAGLVKFDFLGLKTLTVPQKAVDL